MNPYQSPREDSEPKPAGGIPWGEVLFKLGLVTLGVMLLFAIVLVPLSLFLYAIRNWR